MKTMQEMIDKVIEEKWTHVKINTAGKSTAILEWGEHHIRNDEWYLSLGPEAYTNLMTEPLPKGFYFKVPQHATEFALRFA